MSFSESSIDIVLLGMLLDAAGPRTLETLGSELGVDAVEVGRRLDDLGRYGCVIDTHPQHGVKLNEAGLGCWTDYIEARHATGVGRRVTVYRETASTQIVAREVVQNEVGGEAGRVIVADHQTAGRGRLGREWLAEPGAGLLMTVIVRRDEATADRLVIGSCCALAGAIESAGGSAVDCEIRWPNDVMMGGKKVAGILVETLGEFALIGMGVNVWGAPEVLAPDHHFEPPQATSLEREGVRIDRLGLLDRLLFGLDECLFEASDDDLRERWRSRSSLIQKRVTLMRDGERVRGRVVDIDPLHGLMVQVDRGAVVTVESEKASLLSG